MPLEYERPYLQLVRFTQALLHLLPLYFPPLILHFKILLLLGHHHHHLRMLLQRRLSQPSISILPLFLLPHHPVISGLLLRLVIHHYPLLLLSLYFLHLKGLK